MQLADVPSMKPRATMPWDRWSALMADDDKELTAEEIKEGYHFCYDWDGLLVGPDMKEMETCRCFKKGEL